MQSEKAAYFFAFAVEFDYQSLYYASCLLVAVSVVEVVAFIVTDVVIVAVVIVLSLVQVTFAMYN